MIIFEFDTTTVLGFYFGDKPIAELTPEESTQYNKICRSLASEGRNSKYWMFNLVGNDIPLLLDIFFQGKTADALTADEATAYSQYRADFRKQMRETGYYNTVRIHKSLGVKQSDEKIEKISASLKGRIPWNKGIPRSDTLKQRQSEKMDKYGILADHFGGRRYGTLTKEEKGRYRKLLLATRSNVAVAETVEVLSDESTADV